MSNQTTATDTNVRSLNEFLRNRRYGKSYKTSTGAQRELDAVILPLLTDSSYAIVFEGGRYHPVVFISSNDLAIAVVIAQAGCVVWG